MLRLSIQGGKINYLEFNILKMSVDVDLLENRFGTVQRVLSLFTAPSLPPYSLERTIPHPRVSSLQVICSRNKKLKFSLFKYKQKFGSH